ncbi:Aspartate/methionine/tyrosine aminotransferase [Cohaesibacter sp. ES.047]|uniref:pyridoxal phosphate-dependent aminotransferase n=1 Tax=Cohaesibacter sp. ES.047 TaxID=1798205 RepID=UPI000BB96B0C|nr:pyridoxal phosphate-dependent aminotransferase [Cohaesibacter sp. ES.047]SNY91928.1 Aspartate/methionine/tyrosine aminotransferase [Cohaesibacter sp. ES.047]
MASSHSSDTAPDLGRDLLANLSHEATKTPPSGIVDIRSYAADRQDVVPLWVGEGCMPTPDFICEAANQSLKAGETFYTHQCGIPELREAIARYHERLYGRPFSTERFFVTGSGMQAIQIAVRILASPGDEIVVPTPAWPNLAAAVQVASARPVEVPLDFSPEGWHLDLDKLFAACTERTKALFINSPSNPTGWVASSDQIKAILDFARERDLWIIADEIYTRCYYGEDRATAPSFYDICEENDKIFFVNSMSKNWAMTGWRVGWLSAPPALGDIISNLIQYSTSGVAPFMQRAAVVALNNGELFITEQIERAREGRTKLLTAFAGHNSLKYAPPMGSFYFFFGLDGVTDALPVTRKLVDEAGVGLAPGFAFGQSGSAFMRLCFATNPDQMDKAIDRLTHWLIRQ